MSFTKAAKYWSDAEECVTLQKGSGIPDFLKNDDGIWKPDHGE
jgi:hypothetical protein